MGDVESQSLRVVQFNLENLFVYLDQYSQQDLTQLSEDQWQKMSISLHPNKPLKKLWSLAKIIHDLDPDILMLNEVGGPESLHNFNKYFLHDAFHRHITEGNSDRGIDIGYLTRRTLPFEFRLETHRERDIDFNYPHELLLNPPPPSHKFSRDVSELHMLTPNSEELQLIFLLVHLKSKLDSDGIDPSGTLRRSAEVTALAKIYNERRALHPQCPFVVAGDFNGQAGPETPGPEFSDLHNLTDLTELWSHLGVKQSERQTLVQLAPEAKSNPQQLDYFFLSPEALASVVATGCGVYRFKDVWGQDLPPPRSMAEKYSLPSDHFPIVLTINQN
ncbi:MAG: endonuclease/exonuclease/phosphatase family protein [Pseudobdellovibrionaceae bacterium]|nr:MAG: endonuclease/exonuclease/phosphatase family protein [Pseudobdellovibrionaceae bacterium]